ncbi:MAG: Bug family tripartite tricarboxylate transporter substrate binding protein [Xanthobacteraceae bacterium]
MRGSAARQKLRAAGCATAMLVMAATAAVAQTWPTRTITAVVPFAAGNAIDAVGRILMDELSRQLGQPVIVENRAGAGGTVGAAAVARAAPDGHTLLLYSSSFSISHSIHVNLPYDTFNDFTPVVPFGLQPTVLVTAPSKGFRTLGELVTAAKAKPGAMSFASAGIGAASHMAAERLRVSAGFEALHVPFRGPTDALTAAMTGQVDFYFLPIAAALPLINDGKLTVLAVSTAKRATALPDVPTTTEAGLKDSAYDFWVGMFVPAKTPAEIVSKLHAQTQKALDAPSVKDRYAKLGVEPMRMTQEEFARYFRADVEDTAKLVKAARIPTQERN